MKESEKLEINYSGKTIVKNTIYNLLGYCLPLIFGLAFIPILIKGLGDEKFGILNLAWVVIGYFSFFDFGIGKALTKIIAEKLATNQTKEIHGIFWTSFFLMLIISSVGALILIVLAPTIVYDFLNITEGTQPDTLNAFYVLAFSIPIVTTTAGIRGVLEAYQKFGIINVIRVLLGVSTFLSPLLCLFFTTDLFWIVIFLTLVRIMIWIIYFQQCLSLNKSLLKKFHIELRLIKPIFKLSSWMTVSNITVPVIVYLDRFLIGSLVSATAIAYYATPYEVVTKLLLIPGALTGVLFPAFSANYLNKPDFTKKLLIRAIKYIFIIVYPIILLIIIFAHEGLGLWLGDKFADNSVLILQLLAAGILFNSITYIPFTFLEGIGKPNITAKVQLIELPLYFFSMWFAIKHNGINGAAFIWLLRMVLDSLILFILAGKEISFFSLHNFKFAYILILLFIVTSIFPVIVTNVILKFTLTSVILIVFSLFTWKLLLVKEEKFFLISQIKYFINKAYI